MVVEVVTVAGVRALVALKCGSTVLSLFTRELLRTFAGYNLLRKPGNYQRRYGPPGVGGDRLLAGPRDK